MLATCAPPLSAFSLNVFKLHLSDQKPGNVTPTVGRTAAQYWKKTKACDNLLAQARLEVQGLGASRPLVPGSKQRQSQTSAE